MYIFAFIIFRYDLARVRQAGFLLHRQGVHVSTQHDYRSRSIAQDTDYAVAADFSAVYADAAQAPFGTYSEVEGTTTSAVPAVCSTAQVVPLATPGVKNSGNPCPLAGANFCAFTEAGQPTCQFTVVTPATNQGGPFAFTGYRAIDVGSFDAWGRLSNGNKCDIQGAQVPPSFDSCTQPSINNR